MADEPKPVATDASVVPPSRSGRGYPEPFASRVAGRVRRALGDVFGLTHFGVNLTRLPPGGMSALRHTHSGEDEFVYVLEGEPILVTNAGETAMRPGMCAGFKSGSGNAHHLINRTDREIVYLEIGDRAPHRKIVEVLRDLWGTVRFDTGKLNIKLNMKSAGYGAPVEWHQD